MRRIVLLSLGLLLPGDINRAMEPYGPCEGQLVASDARLECHLLRIAGKNAASCGRFRRPLDGTMAGPLALSREERPTASRCITAAFREKRGFFFSVAQFGVDSDFAVGLVSEPSGHISRFSYVSDPCGPAGHGSRIPGCAGKLTTTPCPPPMPGRAIDPEMTCR
jgi:hypothetical protein